MLQCRQKMSSVICQFRHTCTEKHCRRFSTSLPVFCFCTEIPCPCLVCWYSRQSCTGKNKIAVEIRLYLVYNRRILDEEDVKMLFRKKIERSCDYCIYGTRLEDGQILCRKKGLRSPADKCFRFRYDPCKRIPRKAKALDFSKYDDVDFSL